MRECESAALRVGSRMLEVNPHSRCTMRARIITSFQMLRGAHIDRVASQRYPAHDRVLSSWFCQCFSMIGRTFTLCIIQSCKQSKFLRGSGHTWALDPDTDAERKRIENSRRVFASTTHSLTRNAVKRTAASNIPSSRPRRKCKEWMKRKFGVGSTRVVKFVV